MPPRRRPATPSSNFGVGRRESHGADAFYARFEAPKLSADEDVTPHVPGASCVCGNARHMEAVADDSDLSAFRMSSQPSSKFNDTAGLGVSMKTTETVHSKWQQHEADRGHILRRSAWLPQ